MKDRQEPHSMNDADTTDGTPSPRSFRVLVADDEERIQEMFCRALAPPPLDAR